MCRSRELALSLLVLQLASVSLTQQDPCLRRTIAVNVMTPDGNLVWGLQPSDFKTQLGRRSVEIVSVTDDISEHRAVIVLDASSSMTDEWKPSVAVAEFLVKSTPHTAFALLTFSDQLKERVGFDQGNGDVTAKLARLGNPPDTAGKTALLDTLHEALVLLTPPQLGDAIFVISDGEDNHSHLTESEVRKEFLASKVRLFGFAPIEPAASRGRTPEEAGGVGLLYELTKESGGDFVVRTGLPDLKARAFGREISEFYRLEIKLPAPLDRPHSWKLEMSEPKGTKGRPLLVIYPERLMPCEPRGD